MEDYKITFTRTDQNGEDHNREYNLYDDGEGKKDVLIGAVMEHLVNGVISSKRDVAERMARSHRYLQNELFHLFIEYANILAKNYENGRYDGRNESACKNAKTIMDTIYGGTLNL